MLTGTCCAAVSMLMLGSYAARAELQFTDVTASAGVEFTQIGDHQVPIGAGAAWVDVDGDGDDDLYATQMVGCNRLYLNDGKGEFTELLGAGGADDCTGVTFAVGAADIDNDGDQDLFVGNKGQNRLYENSPLDGQVRFIDITESAGLGNDGERTTGVITFGDFDADGFLDIFVGNHIVPPETPDNGFLPVTCTADYLWHNNGDGSFDDVGPSTGIALSGLPKIAGCALAATFTDFDNDGDADLAVVNDFGTESGTGVPNRLFRNDGPGVLNWTFTDVSDVVSFDYPQAGMGIAIGDINRDGTFDYYSTDVGSNDLASGDPFDFIFANVAKFLGVDANDQDIFGGRGLVGWGTGFFDMDHDGWEDLIVVNGGVPIEKFPVTFGGDDYQHANPVYLFLNNWPNPFPEVHEQVGMTAQKLYRGSSVTDLDDDGDLDLLVSTFEGTNTLYRNDLNPTGGGEHWVKVRVQGTVSNRDGIGTRLRLTTATGTQLLREVDGGSGYAGRNTLQVHFGTGSEDRADINAVFPSGIETEVLDVALDSTQVFVEPLLSARFKGDEEVVGTAGETFSLELTVRNHSDAAQTRELWMVRQTPAGAEVVFRAPRTITLGAGQSFSFTVTLPTTPNTQLGRHRVIARAGEFPEVLTQQDHVDLILSAP
ncbi:MAG: FG-GAP-like repeat-containing protein [Pseudomonadota bacterium]